MNQQNETSGQRATRRSKGRVTIKSIMVLTAVFAAAAVSLGHLFRAVLGNESSEIGKFVIITAMLPMVVLVCASMFFKLFGRFIK